MRDALNATGRRIYYSITQGVPYDDGPSRSKMHCYGESVFTTKPYAGRQPRIHPGVRGHHCSL